MAEVVIAAAASAAAEAIATEFVLGTFATALLKGAFIIGAGALFGSGSRARADTGYAFTSEARDRQVVIRSAVATRKLVYGTVPMSGPLLYAAVTGSGATRYMHLVVPVAAHEVTSLDDVWLGEDVIANSDLDGSGNVTSGKYAGYVRIKKHLGTAGQLADADLVAEAPTGEWTEDHRGRGIAYVYVRLLRNPDLFPLGVPNIKVLVCGKILYDTRTSTTAADNNNAALVIYDYLRDASGLNCDADEIDITLMNAAANVCDELVEIDVGGTEQARYTIDGSVDLGDRPVDILKKLLTAMAGSAVYSAATWDVRAGAYEVPTIELTASDLRGALEVQPHPSRQDLFNAVSGTFVNPAKSWQPTDFPPVTNSTYETEDGGDQIVRDIELPYTVDEAGIRPQRIAKIHLEKSRQGITVNFPGKLSCFRVQTWSTVGLTIAQLGWSNKAFLVTGWKWYPGGGVDLTLQETASTDYDWDYGDATEVDAAPDTSLPDPTVVGVPGAPVITEEIYETRGGRGVAAKAISTWVASTGPYVQSYQPEYRLVGAGSYTILPLTTATTAEVLDVAPGRYDFRVKAINQLGVSSAYSTALNQEIIGLSAVPATPTNVSLQISGGTVILTLDQHPELDVRRGGRILVRHTEATSSQSWEASLSIGNVDSYPGDSVLIALPLKAGSYLVKARDALEQESTSFATAVTKQASVLTFTTLTTQTEEPTFSGTHSSTVVASSTLKLDVSGADVLASGSYAFAAGFNFGLIKRVRITGKIEGSVYNVNALLDDRITDIDDWADFDGTTGIGSVCDAWLETRETDTDPTGSPTWSDWKRVDSADYQCWGMQFRAQLRSTDPAYNVGITTLQVKAENI